MMLSAYLISLIYMKRIRVRMYAYILITVAVNLFFVYYCAAFCAVYQNSQTSWIYGMITTIIISFVVKTSIIVGVAILRSYAIKMKGWKYSDN